jgi:hypothetical protein
MSDARWLSALALVFCCLFATGRSQAAGDTGLVLIQEVHIEGGSFTSITAVGGAAFNNPDACTGNAVVVLPATAGGYSTIQALLLSAVTAGKQVHFYTSGCTQTPWGYTAPTVFSANIEN